MHTAHAAHARKDPQGFARGNTRALFPSEFLFYSIPNGTFLLVHMLWHARGAPPPRRAPEARLHRTLPFAHSPSAMPYLYGSPYYSSYASPYSYGAYSYPYSYGYSYPYSYGYGYPSYGYASRYYW